MLLYWCWYSVLGDLLNSLSISLGYRVVCTLKAGVELLRWLWRAVYIAQWSEHLQLKQEAAGSIPGSCPVLLVLFSLPAGSVTNVDWIKNLWCSSTYGLAAINTDMNGVKDLWCSSTVLAAINIDTNGRVCGALYSTVQLLSTRIQTLVNVNKTPSILG